MDAARGSATTTASPSRCSIRAAVRVRGGGGGGAAGGLAVPSDVTATPLSSTEVRVTWEDNRRRAPIPRPVRDRPTIPGRGRGGANATELVVGGLASGSTVRFRVAAERRGTSSDYSEVVTVTLP